MTLTTTPQATAATTKLSCGTRDAAAACVDVLREVVAGLDPDAMLATEAPEIWGCFDKVERLGAAAKMLMARKVDESRIWERGGMRDAAEYLALRSGVTREAARNSLGVSTRLPKLPAVQAAVRRGELSAAQAHPIADAASDDPTSEHRLLGYAQTASLKELRDECLRTKAAADPDPEDRRRRIHKGRYFRHYTDAEGAWRFSGRGTIENAGVFTVALDLLIDQIFKNTKKGEEPEPREALAFDAIIHMARHTWAAAHGHTPNGAPGTDGASESAEDAPGGYETPVTDDAPGTADPDDHRGSDDVVGGEATSDGAAQDQPRRPANQATPSGDTDKPGASGSKVTSRPPGLTRLQVLRLNLEAFRRGRTLGDELCEVTSLGALTVDAACELLTESVIKLVLTHGPQVLNVTHVGQSHRAAYRVLTESEPLLTREPRDDRPCVPLPERPPGPPTHLAILRADIADIERRSRPGDQICEIPGVGPVSLPAARELLGASVLELARRRGVAVSQTIHPGRQPTVAQRVALLWAQPACSVAGCPHTFTQIDHRHDWRLCYETAFDNLDRLCSHHHKLKTHQGWALVPGTGKRAFVAPTSHRRPTTRAA